MKQTLAILFFLFAACGLFAQNLSVGGRAAALGGASATLSDVYSAQNNQAGLGFVTNAAIGAYYENRFLVKQLAYRSFTGALPIKKGAFGLIYTGFGYSAFRQSKFGLGYGMKLSENFSAGVGLNYLSYTIGDIYGKASAFAVEFGLQGKLSKQVTVAAHVYNPNRAKITDYNNEKIPSQLKFGIQYTFSKQLLVLVEAEKATYTNINFKSGIEYVPAKEIYLRAGMNSYPTQAAFGVGVKLQGLKFDLSSSYHSILGFSPQVGLSYVFGKEEKENETN
jgi:long-subunit fatty acid transport protein